MDELFSIFADPRRDWQPRSFSGLGGLTNRDICRCLRGREAISPWCATPRTRTFISEDAQRVDGRGGSSRQPERRGRQKIVPALQALARRGELGQRWPIQDGE